MAASIPALIWEWRRLSPAALCRLRSPPLKTHPATVNAVAENTPVCFWELRSAKLLMTSCPRDGDLLHE